MAGGYFSNRLEWTQAVNRISQAAAARPPEFDLTGSNPTAAGFDYPADILEALASPGSLVYEPNPAGLAVARGAVAGYYAERGVAVEPERILLTASTSEGYGFLFKLLADPGDEVLVPAPSYPLFEFLARLDSVRVVHYPLLYDHGWMIDFPALAEAAGPRTRAVIIVNPNNPTGSYLKRGEAERLVDFCNRRKLALISDEVFADFPLRADGERVATLCSNQRGLSFSLSGISKICGLPQMKLGWIVAAGEAGLRREAFSRLELVADTYLSVGAPVQHALPRLLPVCGGVREEIRRRTAANLAAVRAALARAPACRVLDVEGGWYCVVEMPRIMSEEEWVLSLLEREGVLVQPGFFFDFAREAFLVLSLLTPEGVFREGVERLAGLKPTLLVEGRGSGGSGHLLD